MGKRAKEREREMLHAHYPLGRTDRDSRYLPRERVRGKRRIQC